MAEILSEKNKLNGITPETAQREGEITSDTIELGEVQLEFAEIVWANAPVSSGELVALCCDKFGWKKTTAYTVLRKLCDKGIFSNDDGTVQTVIDRDRFYSAKSDLFVKKTFGGSLPSFFSAFVSQNALSQKEADEIKKLIDEYRESRKGN